jgi:hypothetical protein
MRSLWGRTASRVAATVILVALRGVTLPFVTAPVAWRPGLWDQKEAADPARIWRCRLPSHTLAWLRDRRSGCKSTFLPAPSRSDLDVTEAAVDWTLCSK